ncbi:MFS transporter [Microterricola pindariensis]|uniref:MFS transporter n=1 Tax=Microterricola pindariensis TaxID=478010 RepID=A0ABX5AXY4_9MICO|nr:MFS transporter [Microterricola pindariensis]PPL19771.1 MFS transporter [Microterricola pindariensis]
MSEPISPPAIATAPTPRHGLLAWRNAVFAVFFLSGLSVASWVSRIPAVRDDLQISLETVGLVILGMSIGSIIGLTLSAAILARFGARLGMILALCIVATGLVTVGLGSSVFTLLPVIVVGMALFGFGNGAVDVMMNVEGAAAEREIGKTLMPLMHAFFSFGTMAGAALGAAASALHVPVGAHLAIMAALIVAAIFVAVRYIPIRESVGDDPHTAAPRLPWAARLRENLAVFADARLLLIGVIVLGTSFAEGSANDWIALAVVDGHGFDNTTGAIIFGVFVTAMTVGRVAGGPILDRFSRVPVLRACAALGIVGLGLFLFGGGGMPVIIIGTILWGLGSALGFPVGMSAAADDAKHAAARVSAVAIIGYGAFLAGPPLLGFLGQHFGILNALIVVLVLLLLAGLCAPAAREASRRAPAPTA